MRKRRDRRGSFYPLTGGRKHRGHRWNMNRRWRHNNKRWADFVRKIEERALPIQQEATAA